VAWVLDYLGAHFGGTAWEATTTPQPEEARTLRLDSSKAQVLLGWKPCWSIKRALDETARWYRAYLAGTDMGQETLKQIYAYIAEAEK